MSSELELPATHRGTVSACLDRGKGCVYWLHMLVSSGDGTLRLRNGIDGDAEILISIKTDAGEPGMTRFDPPLPYSKALYVDLVDHIQDFCISYDPLR